MFVFNSLAFSGHRSEKLPKNQIEIEILRKKLKTEIENSILDGYEVFYQGACYGFDLFCASIVTELKTKYPHIKLISVVPFEEQSKSWQKIHKLIYQQTLDNSDEVIYLNQDYHPGCYLERNRYMVERSAKLICYCIDEKGGTAYTKNYAIKKGLVVVNLFSK